MDTFGMEFHFYVDGWQLAVVLWHLEKAYRKAMYLVMVVVFLGCEVLGLATVTISCTGFRMMFIRLYFSSH